MTENMPAPRPAPRHSVSARAGTRRHHHGPTAPPAPAFDRRTGAPSDLPSTGAWVGLLAALPVDPAHGTFTGSAQGGGAAHRRKAGCPNPVPAIRPDRGARGEPVRRHCALVRGPALCRSSRARARHGGGGGGTQPGSVATPGRPTAAPTRRRPVLTFPGARLARPTASPAVTGAPCQIPGRSPAGHQRPETPRRPPVPWGGGAICLCGAGGAPGKPGAPLWNQTTNKQI